MTGFSVDPDTIRRCTTDIRAAADQLDAAVDDFVQRLGGDPWGTDMLGGLIGGGYTAIEELALKTYSSVVEFFDEAADRLDLMSEGYDTTETQTGDGFDTLRRAI
jgi:hypothetical protein